MKENDSTEVDQLFCRICKYYYGDKRNLSSLKGRTKNQLRAYIDGTSTIKKCNAIGHLSAGGAHDDALNALTDNPPDELKDLFEKSRPTVGATSSASSSNQGTIRTMFRKQTVVNQQQLLKKIQLAHFVGVRALSNSMYEHLSSFEKEIHGVDLGGGYLTRSACTEIIHYVAKDNLIKNVTEPLNSGKRHYYSLLSDGSSNAKTMDEKELVLIKTCDEGRPVFHVLGLQVVKKIRHDINQIPEDLDVDDEYIHTLCPAHKVELAIHDAFNTVEFNKDAEKDLVDIYYFFKKANLKWHLFKRQAKFMSADFKRYKRPTGTRWVEHQVAAIDSYLHNLPVLIGFFKPANCLSS